jgi:hypothetical protein
MLPFKQSLSSVSQNNDVRLSATCARRHHDANHIIKGRRYGNWCEPTVCECCGLFFMLSSVLKCRYVYCLLSAAFMLCLHKMNLWFMRSYRSVSLSAFFFNIRNRRNNFNEVFFL